MPGWEDRLFWFGLGVIQGLHLVFWGRLALDCWRSSQRQGGGQ